MHQYELLSCDQDMSPSCLHKCSIFACFHVVKLSLKLLKRACLLAHADLNLTLVEAQRLIMTLELWDKFNTMQWHNKMCAYQNRLSLSLGG